MMSSGRRWLCPVSRHYLDRMERNKIVGNMAKI
jgi:hypothetical protein